VGGQGMRGKAIMSRKGVTMTFLRSPSVLLLMAALCLFLGVASIISGTLSIITRERTHVEWTCQDHATNALEKVDAYYGKEAP
jgi:hypothetical protein